MPDYCIKNFYFCLLYFYKNIDIYFYFCYYALNLNTTTDLRHNMITYNSYDFSPNIDCWEKFLGDDLLPTDS